MSDLKKIAIDLLSRRDHSRQELVQKLQSKGALYDDIQQVLDWCQTENYQSDERYATLLVRSKINKGYGPLYIAQAAREQGISKELLTQTIEALEVDWFALALGQYQKKYGDKPATDFQDKQKRMGYLQRRGFNGAQIQYALKPD
ncbi:regulatory protein RecX [Rheinheimera sp. 4Y26]|uniref:regulatory protein RecX n=1 Tax=Rheinheimera sp. 4Y26 TaxID=2977811 RepID=UPI0021B0CF10|nr:regulatory protein RecX [Rheinheimera sp. 4Y26]MCT6700953.1 recombination regulator RecX [Rheinheimera sp. 4Y26]